MFLGLLLQVGACFTGEDNNPYGFKSEYFEAAFKVENLATKGSQEEKLLNAVKNGDIERVKALIGAGANLKARDSEDFTALMIAAKNGYTEIARNLLNAGANVDAKTKFGRTALFNAAEGNNAETVKLLIAHGAAENEKNLGDLFVSAVFNGRNEVAKALLVESSRIDERSLNSASWFVRTRCSEEIANAIEELQKKNCR